MADAVEVAFHHAARDLLAGCGRLVVAVSGGGDSVALLHLLLRLAPKRRPELVVAHLDHALRRGSAADARFVADLAASSRLTIVSRRERVREARRKDESLEEASRRVRRAFLLEVARDRGASAIATGHTRDDQAETILMRLARGAGPAALSAMSPAGPGPFVKPLLHLERAQLRAWLRRRRIAFREDPSNKSLAFDRNRVRRLVVPALARAVNPAAARHLVEAAARLREDAAYLDALSEERFEAIAWRRDGALALRADELAVLPHPIAVRVARTALVAAGCDPRRISARQLDAVLALATGTTGATVDLSGRIAARRDGGLVEFRPCGSPGKS
jgi:tRNA(Ile)-lysidine synthase